MARGDQHTGTRRAASVGAWSGAQPQPLSYVAPLIVPVPRRPHTQHLGSDPTQLTSHRGQYRAPPLAPSGVPDPPALPPGRS